MSSINAQPDAQLMRRLNRDRVKAAEETSREAILVRRRAPTRRSTVHDPSLLQVESRLQVEPTVETSQAQLAESHTEVRSQTKPPALDPDTC